MAHWTMRVVAVEGSCLPTAQAPPHAVTQHRGPRLADVSGEVIHLCSRHGVQAGIQAKMGASRAGMMIA
jgi:hypothetical protein